MKYTCTYKYSQVSNRQEMIMKVVHEYNTFKLPEDKTLRVVLRGIPPILTTDKVRQNPMDLGFEVISVARMHKKMMETELTYRWLWCNSLTQFRTGASSYKPKWGHMLNTVELQNTRTFISQRHRQQYGHNQERCHSSARYVKCNKQHIIHLRKKALDTAAICANGGGPHSANFRGSRPPHMLNQTSASARSPAGKPKIQPQTSRSKLRSSSR